ncbi:MAG: phosphoribosyltransferase [Elusimicrobiota bacterium]
MFADRREAARALAEKLTRYKHREDAVILAVPRGGVVLGAVLSEELGLPFDVILTKKIGHPVNPEFAIGSVSLSGEAVDSGLIERDGIPQQYIDATIARIRESLWQRYRLYRGTSRPLAVAGKTVILTDDGAATGRTLAAAIELLRRDRAAKIVLAVPVASPEALESLRLAADETICLETPRDFRAIGESYGDFAQVSDSEALGLLRKVSRGAAPR